ncbi:hypothetical protein LOS78_12800 [Paracoccus sp. MA]|uniref:hypothetical protein n=1 Tax=Paracoccus sp. MA TaxID=2895796 RepID=UPI001E330F92|nr:hypothetical protein [Paracoccus sp. MA]UFM66805.1 hypothetical protein LOS78_12800 [Paracoccus sp. MA]
MTAWIGPDGPIKNIALPDSSASKRKIYQSFDGVITGSDWDSVARLGTLGIYHPQKSSAPKRTFRQTFTGVISAKPLETEDKRKEIKPIPIERDNAIHGVVAAGISLNSLRPLQPYGTIWDVFSSPVAVLDESLAGFRLPDPKPTINRYIKGPKLEDDGDEDTDGDDIEYDATCLLTESSPTRQRLPNQGMHNSYALEARAIFRGLPGQTDVRSLFSAAAAASGATMLAMEWAGPYSGDEARVGRVRIAPHPSQWGDSGMIVPELRHTAPDSVEEPELEMVAPDPGVVDASSTAIFELMFYSVDGGSWRLIVTRIR